MIKLLYEAWAETQQVQDSKTVWMGSSMRINESARLTGHIKQKNKFQGKRSVPVNHDHWRLYNTAFFIRGFSQQNKTHSLSGLQKYHEHNTK